MLRHMILLSGRIHIWVDNAELDTLLDEARQDLNLENRTEKYHEAQQFIATEGGHMIPFFVNEFTTLDSAVVNVPARNAEHIEWYEITKSE